MKPLVTPQEANALRHEQGAQFVDARFNLADPEAGRRDYERVHLPGAVYLHLDDDLSGPVHPSGQGGRHPLPEATVLCQTLGEKGLSSERPIIVYDDAGGAMSARAWWLLRWLGHADTFVLNGGLQAWIADSNETESGRPSHEPTTFEGQPGGMPTVDADTLEAGLEDASVLLVDARAPDRYAGTHEPIDPVAGHIPGAINLPFAGNLEDGVFLPDDRLAERFALVAEADEWVAYCGSGVTAAHNVLAAEAAGLPTPTLYPGSWSEWCRDPKRPVEQGQQG